ncbi:hypothetical protein UK14_13660 [Streptomyces sp. NRRL F-4428]|nr:hypothetical protein UK14_13660 [Streptomyces sp. NRRL F-4428]
MLFGELLVPFIDQLLYDIYRSLVVANPLVVNSADDAAGRSSDCHEEITVNAYEVGMCDCLHITVLRSPSGAVDRWLRLSDGGVDLGDVCVEQLTDGCAWRYPTVRTAGTS